MEESAVWQRVRQSSLQSDLVETISHERYASRVYSRMARWHPMFLRLAKQEACHAKQLSALYYLLYGSMPCPENAQRICLSNFCNALRESFSSELRSAKRYEELSQRHTEHRELFCALAAQERQHAAQLHRLTHQFL